MISCKGFMLEKFWMAWLLNCMHIMQWMTWINKNTLVYGYWLIMVILLMLQQYHGLSQHPVSQRSNFMHVLRHSVRMWSVHSVNYDISRMEAPGHDGLTEHLYCEPATQKPWIVLWTSNTETMNRQMKNIVVVLVMMWMPPLLIFMLFGLCRCVIFVLDLSHTSVLLTIEMRSYGHKGQE